MDHVIEEAAWRLTQRVSTASVTALRSSFVVESLLVEGDDHAHFICVRIRFVAIFWYFTLDSIIYANFSRLEIVSSYLASLHYIWYCCIIDLDTCQLMKYEVVDVNNVSKRLLRSICIL